MPKTDQQYCSGSPKTSGGFTLIELLVVISIVSLLISILLPALGSARKAARSMQCLTNLRTLGMGLVNYANLYNNCIMAADYDSPPVQGNTRRWVVLMMDQGLNIKTYKANETRDELKPFVCPDEERWYADYAGHSPWRTNYTVNDTVMDNVDFETQPLFMRMDFVTKPSKTGVISDGELSSSGTKAFNRTDQINPDSGSARVDWRHNDAANLLYLDGHANSQQARLDMVGVNGKLWE